MNKSFKLSHKGSLEALTITLGADAYLFRVGELTTREGRSGDDFSQFSVTVVAGGEKYFIKRSGDPELLPAIHAGLEAKIDAAKANGHRPSAAGLCLIGEVRAYVNKSEQAALSLDWKIAEAPDQEVSTEVVFSGEDLFA